MITSVTMRNFKVFEDETIQLRPLNILTGLNSSGKSSVIQALRMLSVRGLLSDMGRWKGFARHNANTVELAFSRNRQGEDETEFCIEYNRKLDKVELLNYGRSSSLGFVSYISADRYGPRTTLPLKIDSEALTVGERGEYIVDFLQTIKSEAFETMVTPEKLALDGQSLERNITAWLGKISPSIEMGINVYDESDSGSVSWNGYRATHVGFGLSYTLPIIASVLVHSAQKASGKIPLPDDCGFEKNVLLLIENPEAHLHPAGQTAMGRLLACAAACGVQIVAETHSDHLLEGIRIAVKEGLLPPKDMGCLFFDLPKQGEKMYRDPVIVEDIRIDEYGMLDYWPPNFFDEAEKNLLQLI